MQIAREWSNSNDLVLPFCSAFCDRCVCQTAGKLQGLMPGDLGDLKGASLSSKKVCGLMDLLLGQIVKQGETVNVWPVNAQLRLQFELTARLLACSQRQYLSRSEWKQWKDPIQESALIVDQEPSPNDYLRIDRKLLRNDVCPVDVRARSPFIEGVLRFLFSSSSSLAATSESMSPSQVEGESEGTQRSLLDKLIHLASTEENGTTTPADSKTITASLRIITLCATTLPSGACWTSNTHHNWHVLPPVDSETGDVSHLYLSACSTEDLVLVIEAVSGVLERFGVASGNDEVQRWVLHCLRSLTISTSALVLLSSHDAGLCACLEASWRRVWALLFRTDLRYRAWTKAPSAGSKGELVLHLLLDIVRNPCVDSVVDSRNDSPTVRRSAFVFVQQTDIWNLPVFSQTGCSIVAPFLLLYAVLSSVGLSEYGKDVIADTASESLAPESGVAVNRRSRLAMFCTCALDCENPGLTAVASACIGALVQGEAPQLNQLLAYGSALGVSTLIDSPGRLRQSAWDLFSDLWTIPNIETVLSSYSSDGFISPTDAMVQPNLRLLDTLLLHNTPCRFRDFIPRAQSENLLKLAMSRCATLFFSSEVVHDDREEELGQPSDEVYSLTRRVIASKVVLTIMLSATPTLPDSEIEWLSDKVSQLFRTIVSRVGALLEHAALFESIFGHLLGLVRAMAGAMACHRTLLWSDDVMTAVPLLFDTCEALLEHTGVSTERQVPLTERTATPINDFMDDEFSTSQVAIACETEPEELPQRRKRKRRSESSTSSRKRIVLDRGPPSQMSCFFIASTLLALRPSPSVCELVATSLMGVDKITKDLPVNVDVLGGALSALLICTKETVLFPYAFGMTSGDKADDSNFSMATLVCRIIASVRSAASPHCKFHLFGFETCSEIVHLVDNDTLGCSMSEDEAQYVSELILKTLDKVEQRTLSSRPRNREAQLRSAVVAFRAGKANVHEHFDDKAFPQLVLLALCDLNARVRHLASFAIAAALRQLPEDKVLASVRKRLPRLFAEPEEEKTQFRLWYSGKTIGNSNEAFQMLESQVWDDALASVRFSSLHGWSTIAGSVSSSEVKDSFLYDLVRIAAARPLLEGLCFLAVEKVAHLNGHSTPECQLSLCMEGILIRWLASGDSLLDLPLMLTAPALLRRFLRSDWIRHLLSQNSSMICSSDMQRIKERAAAEFICRQSRILLTQLAFRFVSALMKSGVTKDYRRRFIEDDYVKEICSVFEDRYDDDVVRMIIGSHAVDIFSYSAWFKSEPSNDDSVADEVEQLLKGLLSADTLRKYVESRTHLAPRTLLMIAIESRTKDVGVRYLKASKILAKSLQANLQSKNDSTPSVTAIERLLFARCLLTDRLGWGCPELTWRPLETALAVVNEEITKGEVDLPELKFCVQTLANVLVDHELKVVRPNASGALKTLVETAMGTRGAHGMAELFIDILQIGFDLMFDTLVSFLDHSKSCKKQIDQSLKRSLGLAGGIGMDHADTGGSCGWHGASVAIEVSTTLNELAREVPSVIAATLESCRELLEAIVKHREIAQLSDSELLDVYRASKLSSHQEVTSKELHPAFGFPRELEGMLMIPDAEMKRMPKLQGLSLASDELPRLVLVEQGKANGSNGLPTSFSVAEKRLIDELGHLECFLSRQRFRDLHFSSPKLRKGEVEKLGLLCGPTFADGVRLAASRCLGEVELSMVDMVARNRKGENRLSQSIKSGSLLRTLQAKSIETLVVSLRSPDPRVGLVAVETLRALLSTRVGTECQRHISREETIALMKPFSFQSHKALHSQLFLDENETRAVCSTACVDETGQNWCWDETLWERSSTTNTPFEQWICSIVPSLLICCYGKTGKMRSGPDAGKTFYRLCQRMSALEPSFATSLFPSIIIDLLLNSSSVQDETESLDAVLMDTWIGSPRSRVISDISRCFSALLRECQSTRGQTQPDNRRFLELAVDVLEILRQLTLHRFCSSRSHRRNRTSSKSTDRDAGRDASQSEGSQTGDALGKKGSSQSWPSLRYGTVLRLDGMLVANACLSASRPKSAVFYACMYGESRFGGSTLALEDLTQSWTGGARAGKLGTADISGFGSSPIDASRNAHSLGKSQPDVGHAFFSLLRICYADLEEGDAREAAEGCITDLSAVSPQGQGAGFSLLEYRSDATSMSYLGMLDDSLQGGHRQGRNYGAIVDTLENLELNFTLESCIAGLTTRYQNALADMPKNDELRDKWFKCRLYGMQWDDSVFEDSDSATLRPEMSHPAEFSEWVHTTQDGFYSVVFEAMRAMRNDDYSACSSLLNKARKLLIDTDSLDKTHGFFSDGMQSLMDGTRALNDLEHIASHKGQLTEVLNFLERRRSLPSHLDSLSFERRDLSDCVNEIALRHLYAKAKQLCPPEAPKAFQLLVDHLWLSYTTNLKLNRFKKAGGALVRINATHQALARRDAESELLKLRLEEAQLLENTENFTGAIRSAKQTIRLLRSRGVSRSVNDDSMLAEALVSCGKWMAKHKVESARSILDSYLKPGADMSVRVLETQKCKEANKRASTALLSVSELASSIYETVLMRTKSIEWRQAGRSLEQQKEELRHVTNLEKSQTQKKKKKQGSTRDLTFYQGRLSKEIEQTEQERKNILESVNSHQLLVLNSIVKALSIADVESGGVLSTHVYRMVDMWFLALEENKYSESIDKLVSEAIETIPSFRFVPLSSQLLSHLETVSSSSKGRFQERLHQLVTKLCIDHPYHCIVQLVAVSNGTKIGGGVNGVGAAAFLENTSSQRVDAAASLMQTLRRVGSKWVAELVDNYQVLSNAYIYLANVSTTTDTKKTLFSTVCKKQEDRLDACLGKRSLSVTCPPCIVTKPPPIRPGCDYGDGNEDPIGSERVSTFESFFTFTVGGVHRPKIVVCIGSRGGKFKQLVKGNDEIRQDAVMQQVFGFVNELTSIPSPNVKASRWVGPRLNLVTYNIVPLSPASGVSSGASFVCWFIIASSTDNLRDACTGPGMGRRIDTIWRLRSRSSREIARHAFKVLPRRMGIFSVQQKAQTSHH